MEVLCLWQYKLFGGIVPPTKKLFGGTINPAKELFGGTVPLAKMFVGGIIMEIPIWQGKGDMPISRTSRGSRRSRRLWMH